MVRDNEDFKAVHMRNSMHEHWSFTVMNLMFSFKNQSAIHRATMMDQTPMPLTGVDAMKREALAAAPVCGGLILKTRAGIV